MVAVVGCSSKLSADQAKKHLQQSGWSVFGPYRDNSFELTIMFGEPGVNKRRLSAYYILLYKPGASLFDEKEKHVYRKICEINGVGPEILAHSLF